jgi:NarL family two-component system sensor histidine kinase LiaS
MEMAGLLIAILGSPSSGWLNYYLDLAIAQAAEARPFLETDLPDSTLVEVWLQRANPDDWAVIVNPSGKLLAANIPADNGEIPPGQLFVDPFAPEESRRLIKQAQAGKPVVLGLKDGRIVAVAPILGEEGEALGVLYLRRFSESLLPGYNLALGMAIMVSSLIVLTVIAGLIGALYGRLTSRGLVRRLEDLDSVSQAWGQGDFSAIVEDTSPDEIGQLTRRMGAMVKQIQELLRVRQDLAALEERNRLARDLHDSVKQQVFATTMTLGTAKTWREKDPETAWDKIDEALELSWQAQQELTGLINELRPVALEGKGLAAALRDYATRWSHQTGIEVSLDLQVEQAIPTQVEGALFRVAQEALANVLKHSGARHVEIKLVCTERVITYEVIDDGRGFDVESAAGKGMGLRSMRERIEALEGELTVESTPGTGTRLVSRFELE